MQLDKGFVGDPPPVRKNENEGRSQAIRYLAVLFQFNIANRPGTAQDEALIRLVGAFLDLREGRLTVDAFADIVADCVLTLMPAPVPEIQ